MFRVKSGTVIGVDGVLVVVEADLAPGLPQFNVVGLPDAAVKESRDRVRSAIKNSACTFPMGRVTVNLAPASVRKEGPAFDLPIAMSILGAQGDVPTDDLEKTILLGELGLDGVVRPVAGVLVIAETASRAGLERIILAQENSAEACLVEGLQVCSTKSLAHLVACLRGDDVWLPNLPSDPQPEEVEGPDLDEVRGQPLARRALEIAAAGGHNLLLIGPPGSGKTMLARRLATILPELNFPEAMEVTKIRSVTNDQGRTISLASRRPFRAPHHSATMPSLVGGGSPIRPGEVTLANHGVLFLDEMPEFNRATLDSLRQAMEDRFVTISRARETLTFPANFMLVGAMNPSPSGFAPDDPTGGPVSQRQMKAYLSRISGPLLDRIDLHVEVPRVPAKDLSAPSQEENSATVLARVKTARQVQMDRYKRSGIHTNSQLQGKQIARFCVLTPEGAQLLEQASERLGFSARAFTRIKKVARTIADLGGESAIGPDHIAEAIQFRSLDRKYFQ